MIDKELKEKVIRGLEECKTDRLTQECDCPYKSIEGEVSEYTGIYDVGKCISVLMEDALMAIKETWWHAYPDYKPAKAGDYIVTVENDYGRRVDTDAIYFLNDEDGYFMSCNDLEWYVLDGVVAWMEWPEPYMGK